MSSTVRQTSGAPTFINLSWISSALSVSRISTSSRCNTNPVSISWSNKKVVTPVLVSPLIIAQLMGAAPRYCGNREAWRLKVPWGGIFHTTSGSIRKATTTCKSARKLLNCCKKVSSFNFSGWSTGSPWLTAYCLTALWESSVWWRPIGLSGIVTTATTLYPPSTSARKEATAKSGVPIKTILKSDFCIGNAIFFCEVTAFSGKKH